MNKHQAFRNAFAKYGDVGAVPKDVDPRSYTPAYDGAFAPTIYWNYVETPRLNAVARLDGDNEFVAIFSGLANYITVYLATLLSDPGLFADIGKPELGDKKELRELSLSFVRDSPESGISALPVCPIRTKAATHLIWCAHLFLHVHEVAHIELGHLHFLKDQFGLHTYEELSMMPLSEEEGNIRKAFELQADQSAALTSLRIFRGRMRSLPEDERALFDADYLWAIAVETLFVLFEQIRINRRKPFSLTHPSPLARWMNVKLSIAQEDGGVAALNSSVAALPILPHVSSWILKNGLVQDASRFWKLEFTAAADEVFNTWKGLGPHKERLTDCRSFRTRQLIGKARVD